jgi:hypothetical protein
LRRFASNDMRSFCVNPLSGSPANLCIFYIHLSYRLDRYEKSFEWTVRGKANRVVLLDRALLKHCLPIVLHTDHDPTLLTGKLERFLCAVIICIFALGVVMVDQ